jgi:NAD(P)H-hydrate epimerase
MIPVLSADLMRQADQQAIRAEPIASVDLMERAAQRCADWIGRSFPLAGQPAFAIFCGSGNNGGDGLAIARLLFQAGHNVRVFLVLGEKGLSPDAETNHKRLKATAVPLLVLDVGSALPPLAENEVVLDALFGTGLDRKLDGGYRTLVMAMNALSNTIVSIDMPSGLFAEDNADNEPKAIVQADHVLTFECPKLALLLPENAPFVGQLHILPIGLDKAFIASLKSPYQLMEAADPASWMPPRLRADHKGHFGHALLVAGRRGSMGAAVLAARAAVRSGAGLLTVHVPAGAEPILHTALPEAMLSIDTSTEFATHLPAECHFTATGVGPAIGQEKETANLLKRLIQDPPGPLIVDADAINILSNNRTWLAFLTNTSILTPHPKEFDRLTEKAASGYERLQHARAFAQRFGVVLVLKGAYTAICSPDGQVYFNPTGNPGMAKGGSGDVLTGIITGLVAQGLPSLDAARLGVYAHGLAGDLAAKKLGMDGMLPSDLVERLPLAWRKIRGLV